jgi:hypothetical protein
MARTIKLDRSSNLKVVSGGLNIHRLSEKRGEKEE